MSRREYKTSIPVDAAEKVESRHPTGSIKSASYFLGEEKVGYREWFDDGQLDFEYALREGIKHGPEYHFCANGQLLEKETYRHGRLHGTGKQWSESGRLLVSWRLVNGRGLDLWCDTCTETLAEEHYWPREGERGYSRAWNDDEKTVWQEYFYALSKGYHGIWREWNARGRLRRSFPRYYVNDRKVTKRQYLRACETDHTLLPYRAEDDDPHRELPAEYVAQREKRSGPART
jgi:hypothetical protein